MDDGVQHQVDMTMPEPNKHNKCSCKIATLGRFCFLHSMCWLLNVEVMRQLLKKQGVFRKATLESAVFFKNLNCNLHDILPKALSPWCLMLEFRNMTGNGHQNEDQCKQRTQSHSYNYQMYLITGRCWLYVIGIVFQTKQHDHATYNKITAHQDDTTQGPQQQTSSNRMI